MFNRYASRDSGPGVSFGTGSASIAPALSSRTATALPPAHEGSETCSPSFSVLSANSSSVAACGIGAAQSWRIFTHPSAYWISRGWGNSRGCFTWPSITTEHPEARSAKVKTRAANIFINAFPELRFAELPFLSQSQYREFTETERLIRQTR